MLDETRKPLFLQLETEDVLVCPLRRQILGRQIMSSENLTMLEILKRETFWIFENPV